MSRLTLIIYRSKNEIENGFLIVKMLIPDQTFSANVAPKKRIKNIGQY